MAVVTLVIVVVVRFRSEVDELPSGRDSSKPLEGLYALGLACVAALLAYLTLTTMSDLEATYSPEAGDASGRALPVEVTAAKWNWRFTYPEQGVTATGADDRPPTLVVPAGRPIEFTLASIDVQHSFWIPERRFKRDAFPDRETTFALTFPEAGFQRGAGKCAEFCGLRHSYMGFNVDVKEEDDFERWIALRRELEAPASAEAGQPRGSAPPGTRAAMPSKARASALLETRAPAPPGTRASAPGPPGRPAAGKAPAR